LRQARAGIALEIRRPDRSAACAPQHSAQSGSEPAGQHRGL